MIRTIAVALLLAVTTNHAAGQELGQRGGAMQATKPSDRETVIQWTFQAPRQRVFEAMTQPGQIMRWLQAKQMTLVECEADLKTGGTWRQVFQRANGKKIELRGVYREVSPPQRLVNTETYDFSPLKLLVTTELAEDGGKTQLTLTLLYSTREERDSDYDGVVESVREIYPRLERHLAAAR